MSAKRVIDDHLELANIGTKTHAQIDSHIANPSAHHIKYTDAEAVAAADVSDKFLERNVENTVTTETTLKQTTNSVALKLITERATNLFMVGCESYKLKSTNTAALDIILSLPAFNLQYQGTDLTKTVGVIKSVKANGSYKCWMQFSCGNSAGGLTEFLRASETEIDVKNIPIKDIKNHADATLSGTPKIIELLIGATPYYFKAYPTKT